jgi:signal transduction histidine kinase
MPRPLQILYVCPRSPEPAVRAELLRGGFAPEFTCVKDARALASHLSGQWDLAIAHYAAGRFGAFEALREVRARQLDLPVIVVSGEIADDVVLALLKEGAADHIPLRNLMRLNAAVERELRSADVRRERGRLEEQFRQAQKMEAVGRLAGGVAHDFNNLLTVITGYSDLLLNRRDLQQQQRSALEEIRRAAERGGALTHQLLAFSRKQPLKPRAVVIDELVLNIEKLLRRLIGEDITLVILPGAAQATVQADASRLEQVIMNLAVNARDAMPNGGKLSIETSLVDLPTPAFGTPVGLGAGKYVAIAIADTGAGMDQETLSHLFEPFFTTKAQGRGTGLGLATAYGIIRQSGGAIDFASQPGAGTTASIYLPVSARQEAGELVETKEAADFSGRETILVVEDEARVRKFICDVLGARGYKVLEAARGEEAIRLAAAHSGPIDLILVDVVMPGMSGPEVVRAIHAARPNVPVLYVSGYTEETIVHHGIPGSQFLAKPFLPRTLSRKVREVLDSRTNSSPA